MTRDTELTNWNCETARSQNWVSCKSIVIISGWHGRYLSTNNLAEVCVQKIGLNDDLDQRISVLFYRCLDGVLRPETWHLPALPGLCLIMQNMIIIAWWMARGWWWWLLSSWELLPSHWLSGRKFITLKNRFFLRVEIWGIPPVKTFHSCLFSVVRLFTRSGLI